MSVDKIIWIMEIDFWKIYQDKLEAIYRVNKHVGLRMNTLAYMLNSFKKFEESDYMKVQSQENFTDALKICPKAFYRKHGYGIQAGWRMSGRLLESAHMPY